MAFYDNLSQDDRQRLLLGLGARMWMGGLQGQKTGMALAGGILGGLDDYSQITAEARRAKIEQASIDRAEREADRAQEETQAWRDYKIATQGERGVKPTEGRDVRGDAEMPGLGYFSTPATATTPELQGLAMQQLGAATRNPSLEASGRSLPIQMAQQQLLGEKLDKDRLSAVDEQLRVKSLKEKFGGKVQGLGRDLLDSATTQQEVLAALNAGMPPIESIVTMNGHKVLKKTNQITGQVSYERAPFVESEADMFADLQKKAETAEPTAPAGKGLGDRVLDFLTPQTASERSKAQDNAVLPLPKFGNIGLGGNMAPPSMPTAQQQIPSTDPRIQAGEAVKSRVDAVIAAGGKPPPDELKAAIAHAEYINDSKESRRLTAQYRFMYGNQ